MTRRRGVRGDARAELIVAALHFGVIAVDVLARRSEQRFVVLSFEAVPTGAFDGSHLVLLDRSRGSFVLGGLVREPPFGPALLQTSGLSTGGPQLADGVVGVGAERSSAVGDDLVV